MLYNSFQISAEVAEISSQTIEFLQKPAKDNELSLPFLGLFLAILVFSVHFH